MVMGTAQEKAMQVQYLTVIWVDEQKVWTNNTESARKVITWSQ
jgi:hypothetical protein